MRKRPRNAPPPTMGLSDDLSRMKQAIAEKKRKGEKLPPEEEALGPVVFRRDAGSKSRRCQSLPAAPSEKVKV
jgi:hypothetical protein